MSRLETRCGKTVEEWWGLLQTGSRNRWGVEKHRCYTNNTSVLCAWQAGHLCLGNISLWYSEASYRSWLRLLPCSGKDQSPVAEFTRCLCESLEAMWKQQIQPPFQHEQTPWCLCPTQPACHCPAAAGGIPQLLRLMKINSHFAFNPWLCVCSCVLSILTHSHCYFSLLLVVGARCRMFDYG